MPRRPSDQRLTPEPELSKHCDREVPPPIRPLPDERILLILPARFALQAWMTLVAVAALLLAWFVRK